MTKREEELLEQDTRDQAAARYLDYLNQYKQNQFTYDPNVDPLYKQARDTAIRLGQQAAKDTAAQAATLTGGYGNSYGTMAAQQQYMQALQGVNDIVPDLQNAAYGRYQDAQNKALQLAQIYKDREAELYNREWNEEGRAYDRSMDQAQLGAQYGDYTGLRGLGIDTSAYESREQIDRDWELLQRDRQQKEWAQDDEAHAWTLALQAAQYGDYGKLEALGLNMGTQRQRDLMEQAIQFAQYGDYRLLDQMGVDTSFLRAQQAAQLASLYGTGSGGSSGGSSKKSSGSGSGSSGDGGSVPTGASPAATKPTGIANSNNLTANEEYSVQNIASYYGITPNIVKNRTNTIEITGIDEDGDEHRIVINKKNGTATIDY